MVNQQDGPIQISTYWTFIFLFLLVMMYRGKYTFPLNRTTHEFIQNNRILIYFLFIFTTIYLFSHSLNIFKSEKEESKLLISIEYILIITFLSILFMMFCKCNITCVIIILSLVISIDLLNLHKLSYLLPTSIIIIGFLYELLQYKGNILDFLDN